MTPARSRPGARPGRPLVFIFGQHRSGTTILYNALAAAGPFAWPGPFHIAHFAQYRADPDFDRAAALAAMERRFACQGIADRVVDAIPAGPLTPEEYGFALPGGRLTPATRERFLDYCDFVGADAPPGHRLLFKNPRDLGRIEFVARAFPDARIVLLHRHPGPVIASRLRELRTLFPGYSPYQAVIEPDYARMPAALRGAIGLALRLERAMLLYLAAESLRNARALLGAQRALPPDRVRAVTYEALCAAPEPVLEALLDFLGLPRAGAEAGARLIAPRRAKPEPHRLPCAPWLERRFRFYLDACGYRGLWPAD